MLASDLLDQQNGIRHAFFTRRGGVSTGLYHALNCGFGSGDQALNVSRNRARVCEWLEADPARLTTLRQVHGARAVSLASPLPAGHAEEGDALATGEPGLVLGVLTADCAPILFADAQARVIGAAHAGWRGAKAGIIEATVVAMERLGARRERIRASIGPAISQGRYEVGAEFEAAFTSDDEANRRFFVKAGPEGRAHFDLPGYCLSRLAEAGLGRIENLGLCTYGDESLFFSYRRSVHRGEADYGRQISAIVLL